MIKIKLKVPSEEFGEIDKIFEFKDYLSMNDLFLIGLPSQLIAIGLEDMQTLLKHGKTQDVMKEVDPEIVLKYQLKLLNILQVDQSIDLGTLPMPVIMQLTKEPKLLEAIQYSFGQGIEIKTDDIVLKQKKKTKLF